MNVKPVIVPKSSGRNSTLSLRRKHVNIVERFMNKLMVPGHKGKKHEITSDHNVGNYVRLYNSVKEAFEIMEKRIKKNPVQVLVTAVENAAMYEEVASYRLGGMIARKAVIVSPRRRIDMALRFITQGIFRQSFKKNAKLSIVIANELIDIYNNDPKTLAIRERQRLEREADGAR
ncbi:MAG: 30S ribosomal protein S7 [Candidatus Micrarchaeota archaeon]|nr:30S ribosomal protein S7 [Candidatus Micrarchaeota archaeon]